MHLVLAVHWGTESAVLFPALQSSFWQIVLLPFLRQSDWAVKKNQPVMQGMWRYRNRLSNVLLFGRKSGGNDRPVHGQIPKSLTSDRLGSGRTGRDGQEHAKFYSKVPRWKILPRSSLSASVVQSKNSYLRKWINPSFLQR